LHEVVAHGPEASERIERTEWRLARQERRAEIKGNGIDDKRETQLCSLLYPVMIAELWVL
jgi:hypothetical protein